MSKRSQIYLRGLQRSSAPSSNNLFANAKRLAELTIEQGKSENNGVLTREVLEKAMAFVSPYSESNDEDVRLMAAEWVLTKANQAAELDRVARRNTQGQSEFLERFRDATRFTTDLPSDALGRDFSFRNPSVVMEGQYGELVNLRDDIDNEIEQRLRENSLTDEFRVSLQSLQTDVQNVIDLFEGASAGRFGGGKAKAKDVIPSPSVVYALTTDPATGEVISGGFVPRSRIESGYSVLPNQMRLPGTDVSVPVAINTFGSANDPSIKEARLGNAVFDVDVGVPSDLTQEGFFVVPSRDKLPKKERLSSPGDFVIGTSGYDENGRPIKRAVYRGKDGKKYMMKPEEIEGIVGRPIGDFATISTVSAPEFKKVMVEADESFAASGTGPFTPVDPLRTGLDEFVPSTQIMTPVDANVRKGVDDVRSPVGFFSQRKNEPVSTNRPAPARTPADIVEAGKSFFRNLA